MKRISLLLLAAAGFVSHSVAATNYAVSVVSYDPGVAYVAGFTNPAVTLGEPSRVNPYSEAVDPFNPPYGTGQVVSIGAGGSLTVKFDRPVFNTPRKQYGVDFIIFGNSGFIITNDYDLETYQWIGEPATDGSLFAANPGTTRVSVSADGKTFFPLQPENGPVVDTLFPTDAAGRFDVPVNPELTATNFAGATLADIRALYAGSAGGAGYNIAWARNKNGGRAQLAWIRYVRVEVLSGKAEIDGFSAVARRMPHDH